MHGEDPGSRTPALPPFERLRVAARTLQENGLAPRHLPIPRRGAEGPAPLSFEQERLYFLERLHSPTTALLGIPAMTRIRGPLDPDALRRSVAQVVARHESLRTTFSERADGTPFQSVEPPGRFEWVEEDLTGLPAEEREDAARRLATRSAARPFDLAAGPLFRARLLRLAPDEHVLLLDVHHAVADGWSIGLLLGELAVLYPAFRRGRPSPLAPPALQYADYAAWQRRDPDGPIATAALSRWVRRLGGRIPDLDGLADRTRPAIPTHRGAHHGWSLGAGVTSRLRELGRSEGATLYMTLLAAFGLLLGNESGRDDVVVGAGFSSRTRPELLDVVGFFLNTLPLRLDLGGATSFRELVRRAREETLDAEAHQEVPLSRLVSELRPGRGPGRNPLFDVELMLLTPERNPAVFGYGLAAPEPATLDLDDLTLVPFDLEGGVSRFDLGLYAWDLPGGLSGSFEYAVDLFDASTIAALADACSELLERVSSEPDAPLDRRPSARRPRPSREGAHAALLRARRRPVEVGAAPAGPRYVTRPLSPGGRLPLVVEAAGPGVDLHALAREERASFEERLLAHGALLFRGFGEQTPESFERLIGELSTGSIEYRFRPSPRSRVSGHVYTSTDYPPDQTIFPHNEHAYSPVFPLRLFLCCLTPPGSGGETPIGDGRAILGGLDPSLRRRFEEKRILYQRNYNDGFGLPWQTVFNTDDRAEVDRYCAANGIEREWRSGNRLRTRQVGPAVVRHPRTGEEVWFNHATFFHVTTLPPELRDGALASFAEEDLPTQTYYGDGSPLEPDVLDALRAAYTASLVAFRWEKGDVLLLDNMLTVHARRPYTGARRIVVGMAEPVRWADLAAPPQAS